MKTICWALSFVTCSAFLTGLSLLPMDSAVAKKVGKAHREAAHGEAAHREAAHGEAAHREAARREAAHGEVAHGEAAHGEAAHGEAAHREAAHGEAAHKGKWAEDKGKSTKEKVKEKLEEIFGEGKGHDKRPPGWDKGNKVGWGDGGMPPGLSRKGEGGKSKGKGKDIEEHIKEKIEEVLDNLSPH